MATLVLTSDVLRGVIEGDDAVIKSVEEQFDEDQDEIKLVTLNILGAFEAATKPTVTGLHALAKLLAVAELVDIGRPKPMASAGTEQVRALGPDMLLAVLLRRLDGAQFELLAQHVLFVVNDAMLIGALFAAQEGDELYPDNLARVLAHAQLRRTDASAADRANWALGLSPQVIAGIRDKCAAYHGESDESDRVRS